MMLSNVWEKERSKVHLGLITDHCDKNLQNKTFIVSVLLIYGFPGVESAPESGQPQSPGGQQHRQHA